MTAASENPWLIRGPDDSAETLVLCFNAAGAGAIAFERWNAPRHRVVQFMGVLLPGRELRFAEAPFRHVGPLIERMLPALLPLFERPVALYGHSYGALIAFELARALRRVGVAPSMLFVACRPAPQLPYPYPPVYHLPDEQLIESVRSYGGLQLDTRIDAKVVSTFLPTVRADLQANTCYAYTEEEPLTCPIVGLYGADDPVCSLSDIRAWQSQTTRALTVWGYPGGHFFPRACFHELAERFCLALPPAAQYIAPSTSANANAPNLRVP
ncbi:thioesterase II family protein [Pendulispora albinea]|uniref:Alpha/beta fold hydrolase n=1 Tax=Pendulispora albinea TaxID=2741071 RepID=A0ABZ2LLJ6_9BACT